ncbi:DUF2486 family protein [Nonomuraea sp. PA05]|uniref:DUF2486 family protein n=1 Tax=Nonomuraea sp. PA05 TaxID=2604466 RepID=UPI003982F095
MSPWAPGARHRRPGTRTGSVAWPAQDRDCDPRPSARTRPAAETPLCIPHRRETRQVQRRKPSNHICLWPFKNGERFMKAIPFTVGETSQAHASYAITSLVESAEERN